MKRSTLLLALLGLLTPCLASAQTAPVVVGYRTPAGAAQATAAATPLPVTATALSTLTTALAAPGAAIPPLAVLIGMSDGTLLRALRAIDLDTGAGTYYAQGVGLLLAGAGGGTPASAGAGAVDAGTQRVTLPTDDPAVVSLGLLDDAVHADGAAASKGVMLMNYDTSSAKAQYVKGYSGSLNINVIALNGSGVERGTGDSAAGSLRVMPGAVSSSTPLVRVDVTAAEVEVLPAMGGRRGWGIQIYDDDSGPICCSFGATTTACANAGFMLDPSPAASRAGGSKEDQGYSGAITCRSMGAYTVSVARFQY